MFDDLRRKYRWRALAIFAVAFGVWFGLAIAPTAYGLVVALRSAAGDVHFGTEGALWLFSSYGISFTGIASLVAFGVLDHQAIPLLLRARRPQSPEEHRITEVIDTLMLATGEHAPRLLFVDSSAVNAAVVGRRKKRTLILTTGALSGPKDEVEALVAIALARQFMGKVISGRLQLIIGGPLLLLVASVRLAVKHWKAVLVLGFVWLVAVIVGIAGFSHLPTVLKFVAVILIFVPIITVFCWIGSAPSVLIWYGLLAVTAVLANRISGPAAIDADIGAVSLTRYPVPLLKLLKDSVQLKTRPGIAATATESVWVLPFGIDKAGVLEARIASMNRFARLPE